jgi:phospholipid transport system substrate-binding protein
VARNSALPFAAGRLRCPAHPEAGSEGSVTQQHGPRRGIWAFFKISVLAALFWLVAPVARAADDPAGFIQNLGNSVITIINDRSLSDEQSQAKFGELFTLSFDVPGISRYTLGRYWESATPQQVTEYTRLFGKYIVAVYSGRFSHYTGEKFRVLSSRPDADGSVVSSEIAGGSTGQPVRIEWRVRKTPDGYRISDVVLAQMSMTTAQRSEFTSIVQRDNGNIDGLIMLLRQKVGT